MAGPGILPEGAVVLESLVILGAGGFAREVAWLVSRINSAAPRFRLLGFCDDDPDLSSGELAGLPLLGPVEALRSPVSFFCAVGNNRTRRELCERAAACGHTLATPLIDPTAVIAPGVTIGAGCVVGIESIVSVGAVIGEGVIVNHRVCVGHDARVGDFAQLCPGVSVSGGCEIGEGALLGSNACTIPLKNVGAWATVGAGCCVLRDVDGGATLARIR